MNFVTGGWIKTPKKGVGLIVGVCAPSKYIVCFDTVGLQFDDLQDAVKVDLISQVGYTIVQQLVEGATFDSLFKDA